MSVFGSNRRAVDSVAARVISAGTHYLAPKKVSGIQFETRPPMRPISFADRASSGFVDVTGVRRGRLVAVGLHESVSIKWVARCDCGSYVLRKTKALTNTSNDADACAECLHVMYIKRKELFQRTGKDAFLRDFV